MRSVSWVTWCCAVITGFIGAAPSFAESDSKTVRVSATILPRLELSITPDTGQEIAFGAIRQPARGEEAAQSVKVNVNVFSNLGRPYHVTQMIRRPLTNVEGRTIPDAQFRVTTRDASRGQLGSPQPTPLAPGAATTLYTSDERGKSEQFFADYTLTVTPQTPAGEFDTEIVYTVTSL